MALGLNDGSFPNEVSTSGSRDMVRGWPHGTYFPPVLARTTAVARFHAQLFGISPSSMTSSIRATASWERY